MRRYGLILLIGLLVWPSLAFSQVQPPQLTNDDLLKLIGLQQVQNLQCGKALEAAKQEVAQLTKDAAKNATSPSPK